MAKKSKNKKVFLALVFSLVLSGLSQAADSKVSQFVEAVLLGTEYGSTEKVVARWDKKPEISLFYADEAAQKFVGQLVDDLNDIFEPVRFNVKLTDNHKENANFKVYFLPRKDFEAVAARHGFQYVPGNAGFFYVWWNPGHEINRAVVLIDEKLKGKKLKHYLYEEITQALGPANDAPHFKDSIFYGKGRSGGKAQGYSELDQKLLLFLYQRLKPGYDREKLRQAFEKHWY